MNSKGIVVILAIITIAILAAAITLLVRALKSRKEGNEKRFKSLLIPAIILFSIAIFTSGISIPVILLAGVIGSVVAIILHKKKL